MATAIETELERKVGDNVVRYFADPCKSKYPKYPIQSWIAWTLKTTPVLSRPSPFWQNEIPLKIALNQLAPKTAPYSSTICPIITAGDPAERSAEGFRVDGGGKSRAVEAGTGARGS
jgi:hypothetical protein